MPCEITKPTSTLRECLAVTVTQPRRYAVIKDHPPLFQIYAQQIGVDPTSEVQQVQQEFLDDQKAATKAEQVPLLRTMPDYWSAYTGGELRPEDNNVKTGLPSERINELVQAITKYPSDFHIHPKVKKLFEQRVEMGAGSKPFDYGTAELVAYA